MKGQEILQVFVQVFVYGTLKPGEANYRICEPYVVETQPAIAQGRLFHLPLGYPAAAFRETAWVQGYVLTFADPEILPMLDKFEQHDPSQFQHYAPALILEHHQYDRQQIKTFTTERSPLGFAWSYGMTLKQIQHLGGQEVQGGIWSQATQ